jgi:predicted ester cyclase
MMHDWAGDAGGVGMSGGDNKRAVAEFVERCQNQHDLAFAEQLAERDLVATRKTFRGTHLGELWDLPPTGKRVELEFIDIFRVCDGRLVEHWTSMDIAALRQQMRP